MRPPQAILAGEKPCVQLGKAGLQVIAPDIASVKPPRQTDMACGGNSSAIRPVVRGLGRRSDGNRPRANGDLSRAWCCGEPSIAGCSKELDASQPCKSGVS